MLLGSFLPVLSIAVIDSLLIAAAQRTGSASATRTWFARASQILNESWIVTAALIIITCAAGGLLYFFRTSIVGLYSGSLWERAYLGRVLKKRYVAVYDEAVPLRLCMRYVIRRIRKKWPAHPATNGLDAGRLSLARLLNTELPDQREFILPTRLGNVIRAAERYSFVAYGMNGAVLWPRLRSELNVSMTAAVDESRTALEFTVHCSFLCAASALAFILAASLHGWTISVVRLALICAVLMCMASAFYLMSVARAKGWGEQVRAAFDVARLDLLHTLGYQQIPDSYEEECALWWKISNQLLYPDAREMPLPYVDESARVISWPPQVRLEIRKCYVDDQVSGGIRVEITLSNGDASHRTVSKVRVVEMIPDGYKCLLHTMKSSNGPVDVSAMMPLEIRVAPIPAFTEVTISYVIAPAT